MMRRVQRDPARLFPGRERPVRHHFVFRGIDHCHLALVLDVDIDPAGRAIDRRRTPDSRPAESWRPPSPLFASITVAEFPE